jgi:hypothetical protein
MPINLFAGIAVTDFAAALEWYERLFGSAPSFFPNDAEAVWEVAEHRFVFIEGRPEHARHASHLLFVDDVEAVVARAAERGLMPAEREICANGVRVRLRRQLAKAPVFLSPQHFWVRFLHRL